MSTAPIAGVACLFQSATRLPAVDLRLDEGRPLPPTAGKGPLKNKNGPRVACNPLKRLISDERIQGIPNESNPRKPGIRGALMHPRGELRKSKSPAPERLEGWSALRSRRPAGRPPPPCETAPIRAADHSQAQPALQLPSPASDAAGRPSFDGLREKGRGKGRLSARRCCAPPETFA